MVGETSCGTGVSSLQIVKRLPPPQVSLELPAQMTEQSESGSKRAAYVRALPHQHSSPYSVPLVPKPRSLHAA